MSEEETTRLRVVAEQCWEDFLESLVEKGLYFDFVGGEMTIVEADEYGTVWTY